MNDENEVIAKAKDGDKTALNTLVVRYWQPVFRLIYNKIGNEDDAKELAQETFMKAFRSLPRYKILDVSFKSYLGRIAINLVNDFWRKKGRTPKIVSIAEYQEPMVDTAEKPEEYTLRLERQEQLISLIESLPEEQRQAVKLRIILGLSVRDTALRMGKTEAAIKMLQQRALRSLRNTCIDQGILL